MHSTNSICKFNVNVVKRKFIHDSITMTLPRIKQELVAVDTLEAANNRQWFHSKLYSLLSAIAEIIAKIDTKMAATIACICTNAMLPIIIFTISRNSCIFPRLAWVHKRDAKHMSRFPFRPNSEGTRMINWETVRNTGQS